MANYEKASDFMRLKRGAEHRTVAIDSPCDVPLFDFDADCKIRRRVRYTKGKRYRATDDH
jgi:hypothetical protein